MSRALFQPDRPLQVKRQQGFTTVELLVVIAILVILAGIVFVTIHHVGRSAKENATRASLGNLQGMFADYENASKLGKGSRDWLWTQDGSSIKQAQACTYDKFDFWRGPANNSTTVWSQDYALASPGSVLDDGVGLAPNQRHASIAVVNTGLAMTLIGQFSDNRSRLSAIPQPQQFMPAWRSGQIALPSANATITYVTGARVTHDGKQYVASATFPTNGNPTPGAGAEWTEVTGKVQLAPMLLDGWNNPVIFVPSTGLRVRKLNGKSKYDPGDATQNWIEISPEGEVQGNGSASPQVIRIGRPFFASAGPDGDFSTGDDNLYSFEK